MLLHLSRALLCALLLCSIGVMAHSQDSSPSSTPQDQLWQTLLQATDDLPQVIASYEATWTMQVQELQSSNDSLLLSNAQLTDSNRLLQSNVESLTVLNAGLQTSLTASQADLATSEAERTRLESALGASMLSITAAQDELKKITLNITLLKVGVVTLAVTTAAGVLYVVGDRLKWW
jgi:hypothetical protein